MLLEESVEKVGNTFTFTLYVMSVGNHCRVLSAEYSVEEYRVLLEESVEYC